MQTQRWHRVQDFGRATALPLLLGLLAAAMALCLSQQLQRAVGGGAALCMLLGLCLATGLQLGLQAEAAAQAHGWSRPAGAGGSIALGAAGLLAMPPSPGPLLPCLQLISACAGLSFAAAAQLRAGGSEIRLSVAAAAPRPSAATLKRISLPPARSCAAAAKLRPAQAEMSCRQG
ncbi:MAG: hypothetical protein EOO59_15445, partial [Hymenobacter sp.]